MLTVMLTAGHAAAAPCGDRESIAGFLAEQWAEARHAMGLIRAILYLTNRAPHQTDART